MSKFQIATFTGKTNGITTNGKKYICLPYFLDPIKSTIFAEYDANKAIELPEYGLCNEYNLDLDFCDEVDIPQYKVTSRNRITKQIA
ncbi:MAG TPA: hypothetical protein VIM65_15370 [Cyclobacteriaceae bacterium]